MNRYPRAGLAGVLIVLAAALPDAARACSSCSCTAATEWSGEATGAAPGLRLDLRFDVVDQNELRQGSHAIAKTPSSLPTEAELQQGTLTRFYTLGLDYNLDRDWGLNLQLPYLVREHQTIGEAQATADRSTSETRGLGDLRLVARWQGLVEDRSWGLQLGVALPTGEYRHRFRDGPLAGETLDRGLQNGSGTTGLIVGVFHQAPISRDWDRYAQLQVRQALDTADGFRPATQFTATAGLRYVGVRGLAPQLQLNARVEGRESGPESDGANSGSQTVYLTPGLSAAVWRGISAYGFVQLPVYQHYTGRQLAPPYLVTLGLSRAF